jgi:hypothetical protein
MQPQAGKIHIPGLSCGIKTSENKSKPLGLLGLNSYLTAGFVTLPKALVSETGYHVESVTR